MKLLIINILLILTFISCKKRLVKDKSVLKGEWNWTQTTKFNDTIYPNPYILNCKIVFLKKGQVNFYKNYILTSENKFKFLQFEKLQDTIYFSISVKNLHPPKQISILSGRIINNNKMEVNEFPYTYKPGYTANVSNVFIKE